MYALTAKCATVGSIRSSIARSSQAQRALFFARAAYSAQQVAGTRARERADAGDDICVPWPTASQRVGAIANETMERLREVLTAKFPKGFENFNPDARKPQTDKGSKVDPKDAPQKGKPGAPEAEGASKDSPPEKKDSSTPKASDSEQSSKEKGNQKSDGDNTTISVAMAAALLAALLAKVVSERSSEMEITWHEFVHTLLVSKMVERVVVVNRDVARVYLKGDASLGSLSAIATSPDTGMFNTQVPEGDEAANTRTDHEHNGLGPQPRSDPHALLKRPPGTRNLHSHVFRIGSIESFERRMDDAQRELGIKPKDFIPVQYTVETSALQSIPWFSLASLGLLVVLVGMAKGAGGKASSGLSNVLKIMRSTATKVKKENIKVNFKDVAGVDEAKQEIIEFVEFLKQPKKFTDLGAKIPKGALLSGPPGTGKTLLARATAGEANVPFYSISGSNFVEMFVGVGPSRVRSMFAEARKNAPCIIFIDEIDAIGKRRGHSSIGGNDERENTLNQLLVEMDGFTANTNIVVLAGTNRPDVLDPALTRAGRFDRQITIDRPDIRGRKAIFERYLKNITLKGEVTEYAGVLAGLTPGFVGADIENMCNEAAIVAARRSKPEVDKEDFERASDRLVGGLTSGRLILPEERKIVAYHEAGHAVAGWFLEHADPLLKVSIVPRARSLGFAQYLPKELCLLSKSQLSDLQCVALAGRASEQVFFGQVTSGASDDLRKVTQIVYTMLKKYGMGKGVGQLAFHDSPDDGFRQPQREYSDATAEKIDVEARHLVDKAYERSLNLCEEKSEQIKLLAELLLEKETINHEDIVNSIGSRPFTGHKSYLEFVSATQSDPKDDAENVADKEKEEKEKEEKEQEEEEGTTKDAKEEA